MVMSRSQMGLATAQTEVGRAARIIRVANGNWYMFGIDQSAWLTWRKSTDMGRTWGAKSANIDTSICLSVWYDRWTPGDAGNLIHITWAESPNDNVWYANLNTMTDAVSAPVVVFDGVTSGGMGTAVWVSITKTRGGNLVVVYNIDGGAEEGAAKSVDGGVNWAAIANPGEATMDWFHVLPGNYADTQDIDLIYWDVSANELSYKTYDDSLNSWSETSISLNMVDVSIVFLQFSTVLRPSDGHVIVAAWNGYDVATADLQVWDIIPGTSVTAKTNVVTNADDCGAVTLILDTSNNYLYAFYIGKSDGSQTIGTSVGIYYKVSTDGGDTWGPEQALQDDYYSDFAYIISPPLVSGPTVLPVLWFDDGVIELFSSAPKYPRASYGMGIG